MSHLDRVAQGRRRAWLPRRARDHVDERLPTPVTNPRPSIDALRQRARQQGMRDAERLIYDGWSFGVQDDVPSEILDPPYVRALRAECQATLRTIRDNQNHTLARLGDVQANCADADEGMAAARRRMAYLAAREAQRDENSLLRFVARRRSRDTTAEHRIHPESHVWEGVTVPLGAVWRGLILLLLTAATFAVGFVALQLLAAQSVTRSAVVAIAAATAVLVVLSAHLSGLLFRHRQATGQSRLLTVMSLLVLLPDTVLIGTLALVAAQGYGQGSAEGGLSRAAQLGVSPTTLKVAFLMVLVLAVAMSYMLGLARPHPFQQAYTRQRAIRDDAYRERIARGTAIDSNFRAPEPPRRVRDDEPGSATDAPATAQSPTAELESAIEYAYQAAEEAYFEGLIIGMADPTFTEAVLRRRGLRRPAPAGSTDGADASPNGAHPTPAVGTDVATGYGEFTVDAVDELGGAAGVGQSGAVPRARTP